MASVINLATVYKNDEEYTGKTPIDAPEQSAAIWCCYEITENFTINTGTFYEGERCPDKNSTIVQNGYARIDASVNYKINLDNTDINFRFDMQNLFDTDYLAGSVKFKVTVGEGKSLLCRSLFNQPNNIKYQK